MKAKKTTSNEEAPAEAIEKGTKGGNSAGAVVFDFSTLDAVPQLEIQELVNRLESGGKAPGSTPARSDSTSKADKSVVSDLLDSIPQWLKDFVLAALKKYLEGKS